MRWMAIETSCYRRDALLRVSQESEAIERSSSSICRKWPSFLQASCETPYIGRLRYGIHLREHRIQQQPDPIEQEWQL